MNKRLSVRRLSLLVLLSLLALAVPFAGQTAADVQSLGATVIRVEEDWTLTVNQPSWETASPQVSTQMCRGTGATRFCNFHLNSLDIPQYAQGGLQLQVWMGSTNLAAVPSDSRNIMDTPNETVTWTQYLKSSGNQLIFGISAASSQTWGDFSGMQTVVPGSWTILDNYSSDYSVQNSGITFGANRVSSLTLTQVRRYYSDGSIQTDATTRVVYPAASN
jgi:hypothetical protein